MRRLAAGSTLPAAGGNLAPSPENQTSDLDLLPALHAADAIAYNSDFIDDRIVWADDAVQFLQVSQPENLKTGAERAPKRKRQRSSRKPA